MHQQSSGAHLGLCLLTFFSTALNMAIFSLLQCFLFPFIKGLGHWGQPQPCHSKNLQHLHLSLSRHHPRMQVEGWCQSRVNWQGSQGCEQCYGDIYSLFKWLPLTPSHSHIMSDIPGLLLHDGIPTQCNDVFKQFVHKCKSIKLQQQPNVAHLFPCWIWAFSPIQPPVYVMGIIFLNTVF